ncbi:hypothetical protein SLEP1_g22761 [Rubroshorea leprosula]|uniref:Uncharacterized protein n=1 Tax=Rubroshorea leprosula TaxID=152421 RepID=A0AAV5JL38_9ROSI|nr:hypothetical protein SLEP1_g22761 [Rubroshorea leprosula]
MNRECSNDALFDVVSSHQNRYFLFFFLVRNLKAQWVLLLQNFGSKSPLSP